MKTARLTYNGVVLSKKNSKRIIRNRRTGGLMLTSNEAAKRNEADMVEQFGWEYGAFVPIRCCKIHIIIYEPNWTRRDLDNQATSILDALVKAGVIVDDSIKCVREMSITMAGVSKDAPRAIVEIIENDD